MRSVVSISVCSNSTLFSVFPSSFNFISFIQYLLYLSIQSFKFHFLNLPSFIVFFSPLRLSFSLFIILTLTFLAFHSFIHSLIHSFIYSFIHSFIHSFILSSIHSFIHPSLIRKAYISNICRLRLRETLF